MKPIYYLLIACLPCLLQCAAAAEDGLVELAAQKRGAALLLQLQMPQQQVGSAAGAFISDDGLALVNLGGLCTKQKPKVFAADGTPLKFGTILGMFPNQKLALMKFDHRPRLWLPLAPKEPEVGEDIALVILGLDNPLETKVPAVVGKVMAKRSAKTDGLHTPGFAKILSLGAGPSFKQEARMFNGCFAIDRNGDLAAFLYTGGVNLITLAPVTILADQIRKLKKGDNVIPFPVPKLRNPIDPATLDGDWSKFMTATRQLDHAAARRLYTQLQKLYPKSPALMNLALNPILINPDKPFEAFASFPKPKAEDTAAQQIEWLVLQANLSLKKDDLPSAIRRLKAAIALSPKDYPETRVMLGKLYLDKEQPVDAERLLREAYSSWPESVMLVELLEKALTRQDKFKEAWEMSDKVYELEKIYRNW